MANIPLSTPQVGPGLGARSPLPEDRVGGAGGRTLDRAAAEAEAMLTRLADQDAAIEGLNQISSFKLAHAQRLEQLQQTAKSPEGFTPLVLKDFDEQSKEFLGSITNKRTARFVETRLPDVRSASAASALQWETNARQQLRDQTFLESLNKQATLSSQSLANYEGAKADILAAVNSGGFDPVEASKRQTIAVRQLAKSAVFGEIERPDGNPQGMLDALSAGRYPELDADTRVQAISAAQSEIHRRDAAAKADARLGVAEKAATIQGWAKDDQASRIDTGKGVPLPDGFTEEDLAQVLNPAQIVKLKESQERADALYKATSDIKTQPVQGMIATVEKLKPEAGAQDYDTKRDAYVAAQQRVQEVMRARATDPGAAMRDAFPKVQASWGKWEETQDGADLQAAMTASLAAQRAVGIPEVAQRPLPASLAKTVSGNITGAQPEKAYQTMQAWARNFGPLWGRALRQFGNDMPPAYKIAATMDDPVDAAILIQNSRQPLESLKKAAGVTDRAMRDQIVSDPDIKKLGQSFGLGGAKLAADVIDSVEILALGRKATLGDSDAVGNAIKTVIEDRYAFGDVNGKPFAVTGNRYRNRVSDIEDAAQYATEVAAQAQDLDLPALQPGASVESQRAAYQSAIRRNSHWNTLPGGGGIGLFSEHNVPVTIKGKPVQYTFDQILDLSAKKPVPVPAKTDREKRLQELGIKDGRGGPNLDAASIPIEELQRLYEEKKAKGSTIAPTILEEIQRRQGGAPSGASQQNDGGQQAYAASPADTGAAHSDFVVRATPTGTEPGHPHGPTTEEAKAFLKGLSGKSARGREQALKNVAQNEALRREILRLAESPMPADYPQGYRGKIISYLRGFDPSY